MQTCLNLASLLVNHRTPCKYSKHVMHVPVHGFGRMPLSVSALGLDRDGWQQFKIVFYFPHDVPSCMCFFVSPWNSSIHTVAHYGLIIYLAALSGTCFSHTQCC